jgi:hypothetical protein
LTASQVLEREGGLPRVLENAVEPCGTGAYRRLLDFGYPGTYGQVIVLPRVVRILTGFALASFAAAATLVLFVYAPADWATPGADLTGARLSEAGYFAVIVTPWVALSAALPALAGVAIAEARHIAGSTFYGLAGIGTAAVGFLVLHWSEPPGGLGTFQAYALIAFLASGLIGGLVYWASSGRYARRQASVAPEPS